MYEQAHFFSHGAQMTTGHHWFRSGNHSILAHLDLPAIPARAGVVIVPPFGWDEFVRIGHFGPWRAAWQSEA